MKTLITAALASMLLCLPVQMAGLQVTLDEKELVAKRGSDGKKGRSGRHGKHREKVHKGKKHKKVARHHKGKRHYKTVRHHRGNDYNYYYYRIGSPYYRDAYYDDYYYTYPRSGFTIRIGGSSGGFHYYKSHKRHGHYRH
jgi:hypothetical protein